MTDEAPVTEQQTADPYADLKAEFAAQLADLKTSMSSEIADLKKVNENLQKENQDLKRSLVRHTIATPVTEEKPAPTPEQIYQEKVTNLSKSCARYMQIL